jgi:hypothetical protein
MYINLSTMNILDPIILSHVVTLKFCQWTPWDLGYVVFLDFLGDFSFSLFENNVPNYPKVAISRIVAKLLRIWHTRKTKPQIC